MKDAIQELNQLYHTGLPWWLSGKESASNSGVTRDQEMQVRSLCWEDPLEEEIAT